MRRWAIAVVLAICVGGPILELFDHWDATYAGESGDTEGIVALVALCVGTALAVATTTVIASIRGASTNRNGRATALRPVPLRPSPPGPPIPTVSPPTPLRI